MSDILALGGALAVTFIVGVFMLPGIAAGKHHAQHAWWILGVGFIAGLLCIPVVAYVSGWIALLAWVTLLIWAFYDVQAELNR